MQQNFIQKSAAVIVLRVILFFILLASGLELMSQTSCPGYPTMRQKKVTGIAIGNPVSPWIKGLLEFTPAGYNPSDASTLYPVIIYFHGYGATGQGTSTDLCSILSDQNQSLPGQIETGGMQETVTLSGINYKFIVISPQYVAYDYNNNFYPSANAVDSVISYVLANYRVNPNRVYITGMSTGANMVVEYAGSSLARAQKIAGVASASVCSVVGRTPNAANAPANIGNASLPSLFIQCADDSYSCFPDIPQTWVNGILAANPSASSVTVFKSLLPLITPLPGGANPDDYCAPWGHDTWSKLYNKNYKFGTKNMYEWFIDHQRNINLPVTLNNFGARLVSNKVYLNWTTEREIGAVSFIVEKAGADQRFTSLKTVAAAGNSIVKQQYGIVDENPSQGINYYRLVQIDADNNRHVFETRKVLFESFRYTVKVIPNPVNTEFTTYITLDKPQQVTVTLTDMNGKLLITSSAYYKEGSTGITLQAKGLASGLYLLKTTGKDFTDVQKVVKE